MLHEGHQQHTIKMWFQLKKNRISKILNLTEQNKELKPLWQLRVTQLVAADVTLCPVIQPVGPYVMKYHMFFIFRVKQSRMSAEDNKHVTAV